MTLSSEYVQTIRLLPAVSAAAAPSQAPGPQGRPGSFSPCEHFFPEQPGGHPLKMKIGAGTCPARTLAASHQGESWSPFSGLCGWAPSSASSALGPLVGSLRASPDCRLAFRPRSSPRTVFDWFPTFSPGLQHRFLSEARPEAVRMKSFSLRM